MPLNSEIANLILEKGRAQAQGAAATGQIYGNALSQIGQNVWQTIANIPKVQEQAAEVADLQRQRQSRQVLSEAMNPKNVAPVNQDGLQLYNIKGMSDYAASKGFGADFVPMAQHLDSVNQSAVAFQQTRSNLVKSYAAAALAGGGTPELAKAAISHMKGNQVYSDDELSSYLDRIDKSPEDAPKILQYLAGPQKDEIIPADGTAINPLTHAVTAQGQSKPTEVTLAELAAKGDKGAQAALAYLKPPQKPGAEQDDQRYRNIQADALLGKPVSAEDKAWAQGYEKQKKLGPEALAAAAATRQAATIAQQTAQQARSQDFAESQAGRAELTNKVEQPYLDAKEKASTLRSVIDAAKNGNMEAASVQSLLGTLGLVTMEGVKRINTTELQQVAGAGSLLEQIKAKAGKIVAGQPLPAKLQDDLTQLSDLLEQSARKKYEQGFQSVTQRYGLKDEKPVPASTTVAPPQTRTIKNSATGETKVQTSTDGGVTWK